MYLMAFTGLPCMSLDWSVYSGSQPSEPDSIVNLAISLVTSSTLHKIEKNISQRFQLFMKLCDYFQFQLFTPLDLLYISSRGRTPA